MTGKTIRWAFMRWTDIPDRNDPTKTYLRRLRIVQTPWFALYLHFIFLPDDDRDPHDHPWNFGSFVIRGGYSERLYDLGGEFGGVRLLGEKRHGRLSVHRMKMDKAHRITNIEPGLATLVFIGPRKRDWGFWTEDGFVRWQKYDRAVGVNPPVDEFA